MEIRTKEAIVQLSIDGVRAGGSFATIKDVSIKPDADVAKKRFTGERRFRGDLDVKGYDFSFKVEKRDHIWWDLWKKFEEADRLGTAFPSVTITVTYSYRGGVGRRTNTLSGDLVFKIDDDSIPTDGYQEVSISGVCGECR